MKGPTSQLWKRESARTPSHTYRRYVLTYESQMLLFPFSIKDFFDPEEERVRESKNNRHGMGWVAREEVFLGKLLLAATACGGEISRIDRSMPTCPPDYLSAVFHLHINMYFDILFIYSYTQQHIIISYQYLINKPKNGK